MDDYQEVAENMLKNFKAIDCRMFLNVHMFHVHLLKFKNNMGSVLRRTRKTFQLRRYGL